MATTHKKACDESRIEEEEFYHVVLNVSMHSEEGELEESIEEFFCDEQTDKDKKLRYPNYWKDAFYDPYRKRL